jgi:hypothetical protein
MTFEDPLVDAITALVHGRFGVLPDEVGVSDVELAAVEEELGAPLPESYRIFLRFFGALPTAPSCLFGLPRHRRWGDLVLMNFLDNPEKPRRYLKFAEWGGQTFYFDTALMDGRSECPVVTRSGTRTFAVAEDFADFLSRCELEATR